MTNATAEAYTHTPLGGLFDPHAIPDDADAVFDDEPGDEVESTEAIDKSPKTGSVRLRPYQERAVKAVLSEFNKGADSTLVVAATGTGKTVILAELNRRVCEDWGHGVLNLCHRDELIRQMARGCGRLGVHALIEKANERALPAFGAFSRCVVASVQTMRGKRLQEWPRDGFRLIIVDEAHHAVSDGFTAIFSHFNKARRMGLTATADRLDGQKLGKVFGSLACEYNLRDAIADGWLMKPRALQLQTDPPIDLRALRVTGSGDFNAAELDAKITESISTLVNAVADVNALESRRTIAFTPDVASAKALACGLEDIGISARAIHGSSPDRADLLKAHQNGEFQVLCNCALLTEGYDDPEVACILICRPTRSRSLYSQMVGRATRPHPESGKTDCLVVDFAYLTAEHELVSPVDLFDNAAEPEDVLKLARELVKSGAQPDVQLALEMAHAEFETQRRVRIQRRAVAVRAGKFDLLTACDLFGITQQKEAYSFTDVEPASAKQIEALHKWGVEINADAGKGTASRLLQKLYARKEHGWASPRQLRDLMQGGMELDVAMGMRDKEAKEYLDTYPAPATDKQVNFLVWKGWSRDEVEGLTKREATAVIESLKAA